MSAFSAIPSLSPLDIAKAIGLVGSNNKLNRSIIQVKSFAVPALAANANGNVSVSFDSPFTGVPLVIPVSRQRYIHLSTDSITSTGVVIGYYNTANGSLVATTHTIFVFNGEYVFLGGNRCSHFRRADSRSRRGHLRNGVAA